MLSIANEKESYDVLKSFAEKNNIKIETISKAVEDNLEKYFKEIKL